MNQIQIRVPIKTRFNLYIRANFECEECNGKKNLEIHHIKPKQQGVDHSISNLQLLCKKCHLEKGFSYSRNKNRKVICLQIWFEDNEHEELLKVKGDVTWHDFIMQLTKKEQKK